MLLRKQMEYLDMKKVVTIAGSDATGGGGLEADLKTFRELGTCGLAASTSIDTLEPETGTNRFCFRWPSRCHQNRAAAFTRNH